MKRVFLSLFILLTILNINAQKKSTIKFNGNYETIVDMAHSKTYGEYPDYGEFNWGINNLANLRFSADIGEYLSFGFSVNINMYAGSFTDFYDSIFSKSMLAASLSQLNDPSVDMSKLVQTDQIVKLFSLPFFYKSTYVGSFELERLYFRAGNDYFDIETGLLRISRGQKESSFSPIDFLNPKNPLNPTARPEGKLAFVATFYPANLINITAFAIAPDNPLDSKGWGFKFGTGAKFFFKKVNFEFLYTLFLPEIEYEKNPLDLQLPQYTNNDFTHILGFSLKADIEVGLFIDVLYRLEHKSLKSGEYYGKKFYGYEGLEASIGIDYTLPGGRVYMKLEYLFYGSGMLDWQDKSLDKLYTSDKWIDNRPYDRLALMNPEKKIQNFARHDYIHGLINVKANDYLHVGASYLFGADDQSGLLTAFLSIEPFQAFTIDITAMFPFDWKMLNNSWNAGELGSTNMGYYHRWMLSIKMKF